MTDKGKLACAEHAAALVEKGMVVGLGSGSTAELFIAALAARRLDIAGVPSSEKSAALAQRLGIKLVDSVEIDLTIDGADEVDRDLTLVKGGGGALLREKLVAAASQRMVCVADASKLVERLGTRMPLPVEVVPFMWRSTARRVAASLGVEPVLRKEKGGAGPFVTDGGHYILDCPALIDDASATEAGLKAIVGVVETGLFIGYAEEVLVGEESGAVRVLTRPA